MSLMSLRSRSFSNHSLLPKKFTGQGKNVFPDLRWENVPSQGLFLAIVCLSTENNKRSLVHWLAYDIPSFAGSGLNEGQKPSWLTEGFNSNGTVGYEGPSDSKSRVVEFRLHAINKRIGTKKSPLDWAGLESKMKGHLVATTSLFARYPDKKIHQPKNSTSFDLVDLGTYQTYSYDPRIRNGIISAGQDRFSPIKFACQAAIWSGGIWELLPDDQTNSTERSITVDGTSTVQVGSDLLVNQPSNLPWLATRAVVWRKNGSNWTHEELPTSTGVVSSFASSVSTSGSLVVGGQFDSQTPLRNQHATVWTATATSWNLELLPKPDVFAYAVGVSDSGVVYGNVLHDSQTTFHASRWTKTSGTWNRETLDFPDSTPPHPDKDVYSIVNSFSDDLAVGSVSVSGAPTEAASWDANGTISLLGAGDFTEAFGHSNGKIVGVDHTDSEFPKAFMWTDTGGRIDIHPNGWDWSWANSIDSDGTIVGVMGRKEKSDYEDGERAVFLLIPN
jgi:phosphatidylethanolamine-binding protein (PEBP) family uncharacterized protein